MAKTINPCHDTRMRESGPGVQSMNAVNPVSFLVHMKFEKRSVEVRDSGKVTHRLGLEKSMEHVPV